MAVDKQIRQADHAEFGNADDVAQDLDIGAGVALELENLDRRDQVCPAVAFLFPIFLPSADQPSYALQSMVGVLQPLQFLFTLLGKLAGEQPILGLPGLRMGVVSVEFGGCQLYIDFVTRDSEVFELAAGNAEARFALVGRIARRVNIETGHYAVGCQHVGDVDSFQRRECVSGVEVVALVVAPSDLGVRVGYGEKAVELEILDPVAAPASVGGQHRRGLGRDGMPGVPRQLTSGSISGSTVDILQL